jgi:hypothetical protein
MRKSLTLFLLLVGSGFAHAEYHEKCTVVYENTSKKYDVSCVYATGYELNQATNSFKYDMYGTYAIVFWSEHEATIIKMRGFFACGMEASNGCASNNLTAVHGTDQEDREWKVCDKDLLFC